MTSSSVLGDVVGKLCSKKKKKKTPLKKYKKSGCGMFSVVCPCGEKVLGIDSYGSLVAFCPGFCIVNWIYSDEIILC